MIESLRLQPQLSSNRSHAIAGLAHTFSPLIRRHVSVKNGKTAAKQSFSNGAFHTHDVVGKLGSSKYLAI